MPAPLVVAVGLGWVCLGLHGRRSRASWLVVAAVCGACAAWGAVRAEAAWQAAWRPSLRVLFETVAHERRLEAEQAGRPLPVDDSAVLVVSGRLRADAAATALGAVSLQMDVDWAGRANGGEGEPRAAMNPVEGGVALSVAGGLSPDRMVAWRAGRRVRAIADVHRVARYLDPGVADQERVQARRGVTLVGSVKSAALVEVVATASPLDEMLASARAFSRRAIADSVGRWSPRAAAIVSAIVIGDRSGLEPEVETRLQEAGTYHVIAISGGNIAILAAVTLWAFRVAGALGRTAMIVSAVGLSAYGALVNGGASVDRAVLMAVVYFLARAWDLRSPPIQPLLLAAGVLTLRDPLVVADPSWLLTFGATAAILGGASAVDLARVPRLLAPAAGMALASAAAELGLLPVSASVFSRVTCAGLVLNFAAIPLMAVAQFAGMALVPLWLVWPSAAHALGWTAWVGAEGLVRSAALVAWTPWVTWRVVPPSWWVVVFHYAAWVATWWLWRGARQPSPWTAPAWRRRLVPLCGVVAAIAVARPPLLAASRTGDGHLHVTFIDVGQGDAALVRFPRGNTLLIDAGGLPGGGGFDIGERVVAPVLRQAGVRRLGVVALSHGDADHAGGAEAVLREFHPFMLWEGVPVPRLPVTTRLRAAALEEGTLWTNLQALDRTTVDGVDVQVLHPRVPEWERQRTRNDDSVVLELRWRDVSFVFPGDLGADGEADVVPRLEPARLRVLKVPHHGSQTSSSPAFLAALRPDAAVISVGRANTFGHPSPPVLARYVAAGVALFRTDQAGAVFMESDGTTIDVRTWTGDRTRLTPYEPARAPP